jgi:hypothetical protein
MASLVALTLVAFGTNFQSFSYGTSFGFDFSFLEGVSGAYSPVLTLLFHLLAALGFTTLTAVLIRVDPAAHTQRG